MRGPRVVDEQVNPAEASLDPGEKLLDLGSIVQVAANRDRPDADRLGGRVERELIATCNDDGCSLIAKNLGNGPPNTAISPGDKGNLVFQSCGSFYH